MSHHDPKKSGRAKGADLRTGRAARADSAADGGDDESARRRLAAGVTADLATDDAALGRAFHQAHVGADSARDHAYDDAVHSLGDHSQDETPYDALVAAEDAQSDDEEIFDGTGHIPDRDQAFGVDHKEFPGSASPGTEYEGDEEDAIKGDRDSNTDAFDALQHVGHLTRPEAREPGRSPTPAPFARNRRNELEGLTDEELRDRARALSIPGRGRMSRMQLAQAVRDAAHHV